MRLSDEQRAKWLNDARLTQSHGYVGHPMERGEIIIGLGKLALDLADELATVKDAHAAEHELAVVHIKANARMIDDLAAMTDAWVGAELREESLRYKLAAAQRREKRLKRQVELMGWLIRSHEADIAELGEYAVSQGSPSFDQMGDPSDEGEYTDDDLDMMKDHWPAAREELERRQMAADWPTGEGMQEIDERENPR